jgi:hypothetical protein
MASLIRSLYDLGLASTISFLLLGGWGESQPKHCPCLDWLANTLTNNVTMRDVHLLAPRSSIIRAVWLTRHTLQQNLLS